MLTADKDTDGMATLAELGTFSYKQTLSPLYMRIQIYKLFFFLKRERIFLIFIFLVFGGHNIFV
ncbi:hypothetical protein V4Y02_24190, partial [Escherichia coli]